MNKFEKAITEYIKSAKLTKNIFVGDRITQDLMEKHKYCQLENDEKPLVVINKSGGLSGCFTGIVITNKSIHYRLVKNSFWTGLVAFLMPAIIGKMDLEDIKHFQIGEHDACFGTAYVGHTLMLNDNVYGLVRMGSGIEYDEGMIHFINGLSTYLVNQKLFDKKPIEYVWQ